MCQKNNIKYKTAVGIRPKNNRGEGNRLGLEDPDLYKNWQEEEGMYELYTKDGFMTGCPLFENTDDGYTAFSNLTVDQRKSFDPKGYLLAVKLSLYKDEESLYLYKQYFCGMSKTIFCQCTVLEVGDRENLQK